MKKIIAFTTLSLLGYSFSFAQENLLHRFYISAHGGIATLNMTELNEFSSSKTSLNFNDFNYASATELRVGYIPFADTKFRILVSYCDIRTSQTKQGTIKVVDSNNKEETATFDHTERPVLTSVSLIPAYFWGIGNNDKHMLYVGAGISYNEGRLRQRVDNVKSTNPERINVIIIDDTWENSKVGFTSMVGIELNQSKRLVPLIEVGYKSAATGNLRDENGEVAVYGTKSTKLSLDFTGFNANIGIRYRLN